MSTTQFVPIRGSDRPGDIAELVTPAELQERQQAAEQAEQLAEPQAFDFGPALPGVSSSPAAATPHTTKRLGTSTLIAIGGMLLAVLLIGVSVFTQRSEPATAMPSPVPTTPTLAASMAPVVAATEPARATAEPGIAATLRRAAVVRWAPEGDAQDEPLPAGAQVRVVAYHSGYPDWRAISSASIAQPAWVHVAALSRTDTAGLPDLAPPTATALPAAAPAVPPQRVDVPTHCATVNSAGVSATSCGAADDATLQQQAQAELAQKLGLYSVPFVTSTPYR
jgi:hypothetical protein